MTDTETATLLMACLAFFFGSANLYIWYVENQKTKPKPVEDSGVPQVTIMLVHFLIVSAFILLIVFFVLVIALLVPEWYQIFKFQ